MIPESPWLTESPKRKVLPRWRSFRFAIQGVFVLFATQTHARFHLIAAIVCVGTGAVLQLPPVEWCILFLAISGVLVAEAMNTAVEFLADAVHPETHPLIGRAKDVAAGGVLLASIAAAAIGTILLAPKILAGLLRLAS